MIAAIVDELAPELIKRNAVGYESASQLLITAGDNPQRLRIESGFAVLCGVNSVIHKDKPFCCHRFSIFIHIH